jgi:hypothetical protein
MYANRKLSQRLQSAGGRMWGDPPADCSAHGGCSSPVAAAVDDL